MSGRVLLLDAGVVCDVFEAVDITDGLIRARSPFLFEVGEELRVRIERDGKATESTVRVRGHVDDVTELELVS